MRLKEGDLLKYKQSPKIMGIYTHPYEIRYTDVEHEGHFLVAYINEEEIKKDWMVWE